MKVLSLVTQKGGSGKSTLARHVAVAATMAGYKVVIMDTDMQGSLRDWGELRADPEGTAKPDPKVVVELSPNPRYLGAKIEAQRSAGVDLLVIDTPGGLQTPVPLIVAGMSDLILVPMRATSDDLNAFWALQPKLKASKVPTSVVMSACQTTTPRPRLDTVAVLEGEGVDVVPIPIHEKSIIPASGVQGLTAMELDPSSDAERRTIKEFQDLYAWVGAKIGLKGL